MRFDEEIFKALSDGYNVEIKGYKQKRGDQLTIKLTSSRTFESSEYGISLYDINPAFFYSIEAGYEEIFKRLREEITKKELKRIQC